MSGHDTLHGPTDNGSAHAENQVDESMRARSIVLAKRAIVLAEGNALLALLVTVAVFFTLWSETTETFPTLANLNNLLGDQTVVGLMALAAIFPLLVGEFDFSIGYLVAFLSIFNAAAMADFGLPLGGAILLTMVMAGAIGLVTGLAVARIGLPSLVITLATGTLMSGIVFWYTNGLSIYAGISPKLSEFGSGTWFGIPRPAFVLVMVIAIAWHVLERTPVGRHLRFIGSNRESSRLVGVRVERYVVSTFVASALLCGCAGILLTARNGAANPGDGPGLLFPAIAAAFLGATTVKPGEFNVLGTIVGVFFVAVSVSGLNLAGVEPWVQPVFYGASLAVAVLLSTLLLRRRAERQT